MNLLVHVEQYDVLGILPSQLESLALAANIAGVERCAYIDGTVDGIRRSWGFERYGSLQEFLEDEPGHISLFSSQRGTPLHEYEADDTWLVFGGSMGLHVPDYDGHDLSLVNIPGGVLNSRDAVPIALWELAWPGQ